MLLSAVSVLVVAQSSSEIPEGLINKPVLLCSIGYIYIKRLINRQHLCQNCTDDYNSVAPKLSVEFQEGGN